MADLKDLNVLHASELRAKAQFDYVRCKLLRVSVDSLPDTPQHRQIKAAVGASTSTAATASDVRPRSHSAIAHTPIANTSTRG